MKRVRLSNKVRRTLGGNSGGFTLIEVLVALALFGIIAITFLGGLTTASRAVFTGDVRTTAESLARTQMEYVKSQPYDDQLVDGEASYAKIDSEDIPHGYTICSVDRDGATVNCDHSQDIIAVPWDSDNSVPLEPLGAENGLQRIKLVIKHEDQPEDQIIFSLEGYKVDR